MAKRIKFHDYFSLSKNHGSEVSHAFFDIEPETQGSKLILSGVYGPDTLTTGVTNGGIKVTGSSSEFLDTLNLIGTSGVALNCFNNVAVIDSNVSLSNGTMTVSNSGTNDDPRFIGFESINADIKITDGVLSVVNNGITTNYGNDGVNSSDTYGISVETGDVNLTAPNNINLEAGAGVVSKSKFIVNSQDSTINQMASPDDMYITSTGENKTIYISDNFVVGNFQSLPSPKFSITNTADFVVNVNVDDTLTATKITVNDELTVIGDTNLGTEPGYLDQSNPNPNFWVRNPNAHKHNLVGNLSVEGDLTVSGIKSSRDQDDLSVGEVYIDLNANESGNGVGGAGIAGIKINRGTGTDAAFAWTESFGGWDFNSPLTPDGKLALDPLIRNIRNPEQDQDASTKLYTDDEITNAVNTRINLNVNTDVTITAVTDKQFLWYDNNQTQWVNRTINYYDDIPVENRPTSADWELTGLSDAAGISIPNGYLRWNAAGDAVVYETSIDYDQLTNVSDVAKLGLATIGNLENVSISADLPVNGQILSYDNDNSEWTHKTLSYYDDIPSNSRPTSLDWQLAGLSDTDDTPIPNGYLRWNSIGTIVSYETTIDYNELTNMSSVAKLGQGALGYLDDVELVDLVSGDVIRYDGSGWVNETLSFNDLGDTPTNDSYTLAGLSDTSDAPIANGFARWSADASSVVYETTIDGQSVVTGLSAVAYSNEYNDISNTPINSSYSFAGLNDTMSTPVSNGYVRWNTAGTSVVYETTIDYDELTNVSNVAKLGQGTLGYLDNVVQSVTPNPKSVLKYNSDADNWQDTQLQWSDLSDTVDRDMIPDTDGAYALGSETMRFSNVHATDIHGVSTTAEFGDLAEYYISDTQLEPGTIVRLGGDKEITKTVEYDDYETFGVISSNPGLVINNKDSEVDNAYMVALVGKVPVLVEGPISKGQRIVSGHTPGVGVAERGNYVIGRALEDKQTNDIGLVMAVVRAIV